MLIQQVKKHSLILDDFLVISNSTNSIKIFNINTRTTPVNISHEFNVTCSRFHPSENILLSVGQSDSFQISDWRHPNHISNLSQENSEAISCASSGNLFAISFHNGQTGLWDFRNMTERLHSMASILSSVRDCQFSNDGQFLALAESDDFVSVMLPNQSFSSENIPQVIDFIGETAGISFSPSSNSLFIGIGGDVSLSGMIEFERRNLQDRYLQYFI